MRGTTDGIILRSKCSHLGNRRRKTAQLAIAAEVKLVFYDTLL